MNPEHTEASFVILSSEISNKPNQDQEKKSLHNQASEFQNVKQISNTMRSIPKNTEKVSELVHDKFIGTNQSKKSFREEAKLKEKHPQQRNLQTSSLSTPSEISEQGINNISLSHHTKQRTKRNQYDNSSSSDTNTLYCILDNSDILDELTPRKEQFCKNLSPQILYVDVKDSNDENKNLSASPNPQAQDPLFANNAHHPINPQNLIQLNDEITIIPNDTKQKNQDE
jgi:hypothetical protein